MNPLYNQMQGGNNGMNQFMQNFQRFRQSMSGDPRQQVQNLLNSGKVSQAQYDRAVQMANQIQRMLSPK